MAIKDRLRRLITKYEKWSYKKSTWSNRSKSVLNKVIVPILFWLRKSKRPNRKIGKISETLKARWKITNLLKKKIVKRSSQTEPQSILCSCQ